MLSRVSQWIYRGTLNQKCITPVIAHGDKEQRDEIIRLTWAEHRATAPLPPHIATHKVAPQNSNWRRCASISVFIHPVGCQRPVQLGASSTSGLTLAWPFQAQPPYRYRVVAPMNNNTRLWLPLNSPTDTKYAVQLLLWHILMLTLLNFFQRSDLSTQYEVMESPEERSKTPTVP